jgi:DNA-binding NarL/FixJ family response regulator
LDLQLGNVDGVELIKCLRAQRRDLLILVLSQCDESLYAERVLRAGAHGYIMKQRPTSELLAGIRAVLQGEMCLSWEMTLRLLRKALQSEPAAGPADTGMLTERELRVFRLLGQGIGTREIAGQRDLSVKTVEAH